MNASELDLAALRQFTWIVQEGGLSPAARRHRVSQPTLSRGLKSLETTLGRTLMRRGKRGIELTPSGTQLLGMCARLFAFWEEMGAELRGGTLARTLRVAASENLCVRIIPALLASPDWRARGFDLDLCAATAEEIQNRVHDQRADVGYCYNAPVVEGLVRRRVAQVPFTLVATPAMARTLRDRAALEAAPFVGSRREDYSQPYFALQSLIAQGLRPREAYRCNSQLAQLEMARAGLGYTYVPAFLAAPLLADRRLVVLPGYGSRSPLYEVRRAGSESKPERTRALSNALAAALNSSPVPGSSRP